MIKQSNEKAQTFWLGFSFGIAGASVIIYFLGTKKGRKSLQDIINFSEHLEDNLKKIIKNQDKTTLNSKKDNKIIPSIEKISLILGEIKRISNSTVLHQS
ncbi:hypothetical protein COY87_05305 [Candidatus Roizmanbacteria bacterium CG_4_10_14_0_8_um_filter_33_9]|uniref:Uncharacterized protein n=1 Tax=Candidatus Roizmanbacteria bacterium CG_4_10_14_0_8_um_filter_33_9 TaxID=1974826 RepID=A0A2M7QH00_9BACT|nr:MAG: hypothetical protein COY87_05305 [Candidatus Roizmanbacteria bacterium CG_4_10_14_0_8_um_filter_33_9]